MEAFTFFKERDIVITLNECDKMKTYDGLSFCVNHMSRKIFLVNQIGFFDEQYFKKFSCLAWTVR